MTQRALSVVESRNEHTDALVELAVPPSPGAPDEPGVEYVCGGCGLPLWRRPEGAGDAPKPDEPGATVRRTLVECPRCEALNVLPPKGSAES